MPKFISTNYCQDLLLVLNLDNRLQASTFEYVLHYLIEHKLDLDAFHPRHINEHDGHRCIQSSGNESAGE